MGDSFVQKMRQVFSNLLIIEDTDIEVHCKKNYVVIPNIAYKNKRKISSLSYSVFLNEMITPRAWMIGAVKKGVLLKPDDRFQRVRNMGNVIAKKLTWTDDKNLDKSGDYYLYPSETLTLLKPDCEDHAYVMQSCLPDDLGVAYGFFRNGGHAFNVTLMDGKLWVVDTVGDSVVMIPYEGQTDYVIHYIITERFTFQLKGGVRFGDIAGYDT